MEIWLDDFEQQLQLKMDMYIIFVVSNVLYIFIVDILFSHSVFGIHIGVRLNLDLCISRGGALDMIFPFHGSCS